MEDRRTLHYRRNSVIVPKLGKKKRIKMNDLPLTGIEGKKVPQNTESKICSTLECPRCGAEQECYRATCRKCNACFYCGLTGGGKFLCQICGNHIPPEDREVSSPKVIKIS